MVVSGIVDDGAAELSSSVATTGSCVTIVETIELLSSNVAAVPAVVVEVSGELCRSEVVSGS